jgi:hypothetical protein
MSKWELATALFEGKPDVRVRSTTGDGRTLATGRVVAIELEDGSGHCFNVTVMPTDGPPKQIIFVRTAD